MSGESSSTKNPVHKYIDLLVAHHFVAESWLFWGNSNSWLPREGVVLQVIPELYRTDLELKSTAIHNGHLSSLLHHDMELSFGNILITYLIILLKGLNTVIQERTA